MLEEYKNKFQTRNTRIEIINKCELALIDKNYVIEIKQKKE